MTTPERIKKRREELGLSIRQVADQLNVAPSTVLRYETNAIKKMGIDKLEPLAKVLRTTPEYLGGWSDDADTVGAIRTALIEAVNDLSEEQCAVLLAALQAMKHT